MHIHRVSSDDMDIELTNTNSNSSTGNSNVNSINSTSILNPISGYVSNNNIINSTASKTSPITSHRRNKIIHANTATYQAIHQLDDSLEEEGIVMYITHQ